MYKFHLVYKYFVLGFLVTCKRSKHHTRGSSSLAERVVASWVDVMLRKSAAYFYDSTSSDEDIQIDEHRYRSAQLATALRYGAIQHLFGCCSYHAQFLCLTDGLIQWHLQGL